LTEFTEILRAGLAAPWMMEIEFDGRLREKSATGGGGGVVEDEPPQLAHRDASERRTAAGTL
jgi:hypothetical protein